MTPKKQSGVTAGKEPRSRQKGTPIRKGRWIYIVIPVLAVILIGVGGAWLLAGPSDTDSAGPEIRLASASQLSDKVRQAPPVVQEAYRFAIANPDTLSQFPCFCGCGNVGHKSNLDCFASEINADGSVVFDNHALGCSICVDVARDVMRLISQGESLAEIRAYVDSHYSKFGLPTDTEPVS